MKITRSFYTLIICCVFLLCGCKDKKNVSGGLYEHGVIITNEGNFGSNTGSVSYYNPNTDSVYNKVFEDANNQRPLGDVVQSFTVADEKGFIVVNNSHKVEVVLLSSFQSLGVIMAPFPRHLISVNSGKAYLTCNDAIPGHVLVINTSNLAIIDSIVVGNKPENLLLIGSKVFVANGNYGNDSTVSVIDIYTNKVINTINVGDGACNMVSTDNQDIWIICQGKKVYNGNWEVIKETDSHLVKMSASDYSIKYSKIIGMKGDGCSPFLISSDKLGYIYYAEADGVHKINTNATNLEDKLLIPWDNSSGYSIYGMNIDPETSNIYLLESKGFSSAGKFHIYDATGSLLHSFNVGIAPNGAVIF